MSITPPDPNDILAGGGGRWAKFTEPGDKVVGDIVSLETRQQTTVEGDPKTWDNGDPMWEVVVSLQTALQEDGDDDGIRLVAISGSKKYASKAKATADALKTAGAKTMETGASFGLAYTGDGEPTKRGYTAPKLYAATYTAPKAAANIDAIFDEDWDGDTPVDF